MNNKSRKFLLILTFMFSLALIGWRLNDSSLFKQLIKQKNVHAAPLTNLITNIPIVLNKPQEDTVFGVEMYTMTPSGGLDKMKEAGVTILRHNDWRSEPPTNALIWTAVEPNIGDRNWSALAGLETQLINASNRSMNVILPVRSTPPWARDPRWQGSPCGPIDPSHYQDFAEFMFDVVKRYSQPPYNVKYWEIFNEPDYPIGYIAQPYGEPHGCWGTWKEPAHDDGYGNGIAYGNMLKVVYPEIKKADPEAQVLAGGVLLVCDPTIPSGQSKTGCELAGHGSDHVSYAKFLEGVLIAGAGNSFDGVSLHSYDFFVPELNHGYGHYSNKDWNSAWNTTGPVTVPKVKYINELFAQYNVNGKDIYNTESGLLNADPKYHTATVCKPFDPVYESTKASYIVQQFVYSKALGLRANSWFHTFGWRCTALLEKDLTPVQPAYDTFTFASKTIGNASYVEEITDFGPGIKAFEFKYQESDSKFWVVWSLDGGNHPITLPENPIAILDLTGKRVDNNDRSFSVTLTPHYIEY